MNSYGRPKQTAAQFPKELALLIARKAHAMAERFEDQALDQMIRDARRALTLGVEPRVIARQMGL